MPIKFTSVERVTREEGLLREAEYWASRTMAERVKAGWDLAENNLLPQGNQNHQDHHEPEKRTTFTLVRVPRHRG